MRIVCVGGGPGGLYLAILAKLRAPADEVTVYERYPEHVARGWGVTFGPELLEKFHRYDPESAQEIERAVLPWSDQFVDIHGERVTYRSGHTVFNLNRPRLVEILAARARQLGVSICYGREIESPRQLPEADVIVAADGAGSKIRQSIESFGTRVSQGDDKYIWLGTDQYFPAFTHHFSRTTHGWFCASSYGIGAELSTFVVHCRASTWRGLGFDKMPASGSLAALREMYRDQLGEHRLMGQLGDEMNAKWHSSRSVTNDRWHVGNVVLLGDSAHTTHFSVGEGTTQAIEDAIVLATNIGQNDGLESALTAYERQRQAELRRVQRQAQMSYRFFADIPRYVALKPAEFTTVVHARRSRLHVLLPPRLFYQYQLLRASRGAGRRPSAATADKTATSATPCGAGTASSPATTPLPTQTASSSTRRTSYATSVRRS